MIAHSEGRPVGDLSKENFSVKDDGKLRGIDIFAINRGQPEIPVAPSSKPLPAGVLSNRNPGPPNLPGHSTVIVLDQLNVAHDSNRTPFQTAADAQLQVASLMSKVSPDERIALSRTVRCASVQAQPSDLAGVAIDRRVEMGPRRPDGSRPDRCYCTRCPSRERVGM